MPSSIAPSTQSNRDDSPASCPAVRGRPRCLAQRPFPSMTIATCRGTLLRGICGGRAPDGCGLGVLTSRFTSHRRHRRTPGCGSGRCRRGLIPQSSASVRQVASRTVHQGQRAQPPLQMPLQQRGHQTAALATVGALAGLGARPVAGQQRLEVLDGDRVRHGRAGGAAGRADRAAGRDGEVPVRALLAATGAVAERRLPACHGHRPQQERVEHQAGRVGLFGQRPQRADDEQEQSQRRLLLLGREPVGGLEHRSPGGVGRIVGRDAGAVGADRLGLAHDVEVAAGVELQVDVAERLEPGAELALGAAHALGYRAHLAVPAGEDGDDPVGLTQLLGAEDDSLVPVQGLRGGGHHSPSRFSFLGSSCHSPSTVTCRSRCTRAPSSCSSPTRASLPIVLIISPPRPSSIGFWLGRSTCSSACTSTNTDPARFGSGRRISSSTAPPRECGPSWRPFSSAASRISSAICRSTSSSVVCSSGYIGGPSGSSPISRSSSSSTWSPATALTGPISRASTSWLAATSCPAIAFLLAVSVLVTTTTIGVETAFSCRAMNASPGPAGWSAGMQNTMTSTSDSVSRTTSLSRCPSRLLGLCSPGGSTSTSCPPGRGTTPRMACRVVCGRLLTMPTFSPTSALVSVVLPTLGRPTRQAQPLRYGCSCGSLTGPVSHCPPTPPPLRAARAGSAVS